MGTAPAQRLEPGVLVNDDAVLLGDPRQAPGKTRRVEHRALVRVMTAGEVGRCSRPSRAPRWRRGSRSVPGSSHCDLVGLGGHGQRAAAREPAVDAVAPDRLLDPVEVAQAESVQRVVLVGPAGATVGLPMGDAGLAETTVAAGRVLGDAVALDEHDPQSGGALDGAQRGPQTGEPATDDEEVGLDVTGQRRPRLGTVRGVEPHRHEDRARQRIDRRGRGLLRHLHLRCGRPRRALLR